MPLVTWIKQKDKIDGSMKGKVYSFMEKLQKDDTNPGLHIEPMHGPVDGRVRTGRIDANYRAVLFKVPFDKMPHYFYYGAWPHDEAIEIARASQLHVNPINGVLEVIRTTAPQTDGLVSDGPATEPDATVEVPDEVVAADEDHVQASNDNDVPLAEWNSPLVDSGYATEQLVTSLGLDRDVVQRALAAASEDALFAVLTEAPEWQATALLELAAGTPIDDVRDKLSLGDYVDDPSKSEEEKIKEALEHPATRMQFTFVGENPEELKQVIDGGDFDAWRTFLHPEQRIYAERHYNGSFRLSGGAGTGKTVVLLHRARMFAVEEPQARIVLTTYTTTLADALETGMLKLDPHLGRGSAPGKAGLLIAGVDSLVNKVIRGASDVEQRQAMKDVFGLESAVPGKILDAELVRHQWEAAVNDVPQELEDELANPTFLQQEYETVVSPNFISSKDQYLKVPRAGRGTALNRSKRLAVWKIIEAYRYYNRIEMNCSFVELAHLAASVLRQRTAGGDARLAEHVLIDEAQDLHAGHWLFLRELVNAGPDDLFIAEDSHQRIYGQKVPLSRFGIAIVGRSRRLTLNYRTTQQNLDYAVGLLTGVHVTDIEGEEESNKGYTSSRTGPRPEERSALSLAGELDNLVSYLNQWRDEGVALETVGILVRSNYQISKVVDGLLERRLTAREVSGRAEPGVPVVMTMHRSKGMEFTRAVLFGISDQLLPAQYQIRNLAPAEREDALLRERSLLYVAATRARDGLVVSWSGQPSELLGAL